MYGKYGVQKKKRFKDQNYFKNTNLTRLTTELNVTISLDYFYWKLNDHKNAKAISGNFFFSFPLFSQQPNRKSRKKNVTSKKIKDPEKRPEVRGKHDEMGKEGNLSEGTVPLDFLHEAASHLTLQHVVEKTPEQFAVVIEVLERDFLRYVVRGVRHCLGKNHRERRVVEEEEGEDEVCTYEIGGLGVGPTK